MRIGNAVVAAVIEAPDRRRRPLDDGAHEPIPHGDRSEETVPGVVEAWPTVNGSGRTVARGGCT